jgi:hypothetical protein
MSAHQGNSACRISVDPLTGDLLRLEAKKVLMFNHEPFEDFMDYVPAKQLTMADIYRDATAVIDAIGWDPDTDAQRDSVEVPVTAAHIQQLHKRRCDLLDTNLDLLEDIGTDAESLDVIMADIHANRRSVEALNRVFDAYSTTIERRQR